MLGELIPKQIGLRNAERAAVIVARPIQLLAMAAGPVVSLFDWSARLDLRLLGQSRWHEAGVADREIIATIEEAERPGLVEPEERSMISRVMRLGDRSVRAIMTLRPDVEWIDLNDGVNEVRNAIRKAKAWAHADGERRRRRDCRHDSGPGCTRRPVGRGRQRDMGAGGEGAGRERLAGGDGRRRAPA